MFRTSICPKHVELFIVINHNCCIKLVPLVIFIYDARSHIHKKQIHRFGRKPQGKSQHWRCKFKRDIKMVLKINWQCVDWCHLTQERDLWQVLVSTVLNCEVPYNAGKVFTVWATIGSFLGILFHAVFFGYVTITRLRLPTDIVRYKGQTNVSGRQLKTQKVMAAALSRKTNRRHGTVSYPLEEEEVDNSAWSHDLTNTSLGLCHYTDKCRAGQILSISVA